MTKRNGSIARRRVLALVGVAGTATLLSGYSSIASSDEYRTLAVRIANRRSTAESVTVRVASGAGETIDTAEYDVRASAVKAHRLVGVPAGRYRITVFGDGWKTTANWDASVCSQLLAETRLEDQADGTPHTSLSVSCRDE